MISPDNKPDGVGGMDYEILFKIFIPILCVIVVILLLYIFHLRYNLKYNYIKKIEKPTNKNEENKQN